MLGVSAGMMRSEEGGSTHENGGSSEGAGGSTSIPGGSGGMDESDRNGGGGGNRWPKQETLALLKIRSDMDVVFRDSSLKGPLWEEVSRKMAEMGFQRSAKKCREKFENVYKYHKRTKDGRAAKSDGKTYRFFDQLEALAENTPPISNPFTPPATMAVPGDNQPMPSHVTVSSISPTPLSVVPPQPGTNMDSSPPVIPQSQMPLMQHLSRNNAVPQVHTFQTGHPHPHPRMLLDSTSSSTSSDDDIQRRRGKKRKWKECFHRLVKDVIQKQEELQKKFLDTLERRERERMTREEGWRLQEMARMNHEHDLLVQERSIAAAKDAAVIAFLQKVTDQHNLQIPINNVTSTPPPPPPLKVVNQPPPVENPPPPPPPPQVQSEPQLTHPTPPPPPPAAITVTPTKVFDISKTDNGGSDALSPASSSRWPKTEVQALINLRTNMDLKYQENGPKGPLWEEISAAMAKLGYNRSSKRCKEKWENINKYFKKVKESNKKRPEDSKTCPYFHQLEAIYKEKAKTDSVPSSFNPGYTTKPENNPMVPIMAQPEQQWPIPNLQRQHHQDSRFQDQDSDDPNINDDDDNEEDDDDGLGYEIIANKQQPSVTNTAEES